VANLPIRRPIAQPAKVEPSEQQPAQA